MAAGPSLPPETVFLAESGVSSDNEEDEDEGDGSYLHPSLFASKKCNRLEELMKVLISLSYRAVFYCITAALVSGNHSESISLI